MTKCYFVLKGGLLFDSVSNLQVTVRVLSTLLSNMYFPKTMHIGTSNFALIKFFEMKDALQPIGISAF